jgi:hypothetical protein
MVGGYAFLADGKIAPDRANSFFSASEWMSGSELRSTRAEWRMRIDVRRRSLA